MNDGKPRVPRDPPAAPAPPNEETRAIAEDFLDAMAAPAPEATSHREVCPGGMCIQKPNGEPEPCPGHGGQSHAAPASPPEPAQARAPADRVFAALHEVQLAWKERRAENISADEFERRVGNGLLAIAAPASAAAQKGTAPQDAYDLVADFYRWTQEEGSHGSCCPFGLEIGQRPGDTSVTERKEKGCTCGLWDLERRADVLLNGPDADPFPAAPPLPGATAPADWVALATSRDPAAPTPETPAATTLEIEDTHGGADRWGAPVFHGTVRAAPAPLSTEPVGALANLPQPVLDALHLYGSERTHATYAALRRAIAEAIRAAAIRRDEGASRAAVWTAQCGNCRAQARTTIDMETQEVAAPPGWTALGGVWRCERCTVALRALSEGVADGKGTKP